MLERILVGLDGSELAETVLPYVTDLARFMGGEVTLLTVTHLSDETIEGQHHVTADQYLERSNALTLDYLHGVAQRLAPTGIAVHTHVSVGDAPAEIIRLARHENMDLIALATHGRSGLQRWLHGSVADDVLHSTRTPLLMIRPREQDATQHSLDKIVVALDGSEYGKKVLPYVEAIATAAKIPVTLVRAIEPMFLAMDPAGAAAAYEEVLSSLRMVATADLNAVADQLAAKGVDVTLEIPVGNPGSEIVDLAHEHPGTLVIMATHGRTGLTGAVMGSVARRVVHQSGAPILLVHPGEE